jgi:site-specific recombinase XerD
VKLDRFGTTKTSAPTLDVVKTAYLISQEAAGCTPATLEANRFAFLSLQRYMEAMDLPDLTALDANAMRGYILHERKRGLKDRSVQSYLINLKAFFRWTVEEGYLPENPLATVKAPRVEKKVLEAFTDAEIRALLNATSGRENLDVRNRALVACLLDSGLRAAEMVSLNLGDVDMQTGMARVTGKGRKQRFVRLGAQARKALLRYLQIRRGEPGDPLWLGVRGPLTSDGLHEILTKLGKRCKVQPCNPHKFRRTFALACLRNGMDPFSLQTLMGHADLQILRRYLAQTQADVEAAHAKSSPMDRLLMRKAA